MPTLQDKEERLIEEGRRRKTEGSLQKGIRRGLDTLSPFGRGLHDEGIASAFCLLPFLVKSRQVKRLTPVIP